MFFETDMSFFLTEVAVIMSIFQTKLINYCCIIAICFAGHFYWDSVQRTVYERYPDVLSTQFTLLTDVLVCCVGVQFNMLQLV